jgi:hypothetical protein
MQGVHGAGVALELGASLPGGAGFVVDDPADAVFNESPVDDVALAIVTDGEFVRGGGAWGENPATAGAGADAVEEVSEAGGSSGQFGCRNAEGGENGVED